MPTSTGPADDRRVPVAWDSNLTPPVMLFAYLATNNHQMTALEQFAKLHGRNTREVDPRGPNSLEVF